MRKIKLSNLYKGLKGQLPIKRAFRNFFITGNAWGMFSINSHVNQSSGKEKVQYGSYESAKKAADKMSEKKGVHFSVYKCIFCDGYHIGKNRDNKIKSIYLIKKIEFDNMENHNPICEDIIGYVEGDINIVNKVILDLESQNEKKYKGYDGNEYPLYVSILLKNLNN